MNRAYNKDIMSWKRFPEYDIIWCDPPWEQKMVNYFETLMAKDGFRKPNNTIFCMMEKLALLSNIKKPIFIEYSIKGSDLIIEIMCKYGHVFYKKVFSVQENGKKYLILVFNTDGYSPNGTNTGFKIIDSLCMEISFNVVFDPFAGIGKTAKSFIRNNKVYIGSEINPTRFNKLQRVLWDEQQ